MEISRIISWQVTVEEEMKRYPLLKRQDIETIKEWMSINPHLPRVDDEVICQFIYACHYDIELTKTTIEYFYTYKTSMPEFSKNWDVTSPSVRDVGEYFYVVLLPGLDTESNQIIVCKLHDMSPAHYVFSECIKWIMITICFSQLEDGIRPGYTIVYDADGFTMSHLIRNPLHQVRNYILFGQKASNIRVTGIRFINAHSVIKKLISLTKPFLSPSVLKILTVHMQHEEYFRTIPKEIVPADYGGEAPTLEELTQIQRGKMVEKRTVILKHEALCTDESKRQGKSEDESTGSKKRGVKPLDRISKTSL